MRLWALPPLAAGHGDVVVPADTGLRLPQGAKRIVLALACAVSYLDEAIELYEKLHGQPPA